jgi:CBS domain-containing protein
VPVVDGTEVVGILGVREVRRMRRAAWGTTRVRDAMVGPPRMPVVGSEVRLLGALERLQRSGLDGIPVIDDGRLVGVLTRRSVGKVVASRTGGQPPPRRRGFR